MKNNKIPLKLYKTGPFKKIPKCIRNAIIKSSKMLNSSYHFYDDEMCEDFIKNNFSYYVLYAYENLIPTAFKADLWRYCILYTNGGIYADISQTILKKIDVNKNNADMILVKDRPDNCIQISFLATIPKNNFLIYVIERICVKVIEKNKSKSPIHLTGPCIFGELFIEFFNIKSDKKDKIIPGLRTYKGLDGKRYLIDVKYKHVDNYICDFNHNKIMRRKFVDNKKLLYKNRQSYNDLWQSNIIFKNDKTYRGYNFYYFIAFLVIIFTCTLFLIINKK